jgi:hypothetical protein
LIKLERKAARGYINLAGNLEDGFEADAFLANVLMARRRGGFRAVTDAADGLHVFLCEAILVAINA